MKACDHKDCDSYPYYGVAPHECYWRKPSGFENPLGTSAIMPLDAWPANFFAEIDRDNPVIDQLSWGLCGVYICPSCGTAPKSSGLLSKDQVMELTKEQDQ